MRLQRRRPLRQQPRDSASPEPPAWSDGEAVEKGQCPLPEQFGGTWLVLGGQARGGEEVAGPGIVDRLASTAAAGGVRRHGVDPLLTTEGVVQAVVDLHG